MAAVGRQLAPFRQQQLLTSLQTSHQVRLPQAPKVNPCAQRWKLLAIVSNLQKEHSVKHFSRQDCISVLYGAEHPAIRMLAVATGSRRNMSRQVFAKERSNGVIEHAVPRIEDTQSNPWSQDLKQLFQDMEELKEELTELSDEILAMHEAGDSASAVELADANWEAVQDQLEAGVAGIEQMAMLATLSWAYHLMELPKGTEVLEQLLHVVHDVKEGQPLLPDLLYSAAQQLYALERKEETVRILQATVAIQDKMGVMYALQPCTNVVERLALILSELEREEEAILLLRNWIQKLQQNAVLDASLNARLNSIMAHCYSQLGQLGDVERCLSGAVSSWEKAQGTDSLEVGLVLVQKGGVLFSKGEVSAAQSCLERGVRITEAKTRPGENGLMDSILGKGYRSLLELYKYTDRKDLAHQMLYRAVARLDSSDASSNLPSVNLYLEIADAHLDAGLWPVVERLCKQVLMIVDNTLPPNSVEVLKPLEIMSECFLREGRLKDARAAAEAHLQITELHYPPGDVTLGVSHGLLGRVLCKLREWGEAEHHLRNTVSIMESLDGRTSLALLQPIENLVEALENLGELSEAQTFQQRLEQVLNCPENISFLEQMDSRGSSL